MALAACGFISFLIRNGAEGPGRGERKGKQQKITSPARPARPASRRRAETSASPQASSCREAQREGTLEPRRAPAFRPAAALWGGGRGPGQAWSGRVVWGQALLLSAPRLSNL